MSEAHAKGQSKLGSETAKASRESGRQTQTRTEHAVNRKSRKWALDVENEQTSDTNRKSRQSDTEHEHTSDTH
eukprot:732252-Rhodomonas_salina.1